MSTLSQMGNGSYVKYGWGGLLGDFYWTLGRFMPYAGLTLGGGATTDFLIMKESEKEWTPVQEAYYHKLRRTDARLSFFSPIAFRV